MNPCRQRLAYGSFVYTIDHDLAGKPRCLGQVRRNPASQGRAIGFVGRGKLLLVPRADFAATSRYPARERRNTALNLSDGGNGITCRSQCALPLLSRRG